MILRTFYNRAAHHVRQHHVNVTVAGGRKGREREVEVQPSTANKTNKEEHTGRADEVASSTPEQPTLMIKQAWLVLPAFQ